MIVYLGFEKVLELYWKLHAGIGVCLWNDVARLWRLGLHNLFGSDKSLNDPAQFKGRLDVKYVFFFKLPLWTYAFLLFFLINRKLAVCLILMANIYNFRGLGIQSVTFHQLHFPVLTDKFKALLSIFLFWPETIKAIFTVFLSLQDTIKALFITFLPWVYGSFLQSVLTGMMMMHF